jgi:hypothetical protein
MFIQEKADTACNKKSQEPMSPLKEMLKKFGVIL